MTKRLRLGWGRGSTRSRTVGVRDHDRLGQTADYLKVRWVFKQTLKVDNIGGSTSNIVIRFHGNNPGSPVMHADAYGSSGAYKSSNWQPINYADVYGAPAITTPVTQAAVLPHYTYGVCVASSMILKIVPYADIDVDIPRTKINVGVSIDKGAQSSQQGLSWDGFRDSNLKPKWFHRQNQPMSPVMTIAHKYTTRAALQLGRKVDLFRRDDTTNYPDYGHNGGIVQGSIQPFEMFDEHSNWSWVVSFWSQDAQYVTGTTNVNIEATMIYYDIAMKRTPALRTYAPITNKPEATEGIVYYGDDVQPTGDAEADEGEEDWDTWVAPT